jgi:hypothetical protein
MAHGARGSGGTARRTRGKKITLDPFPLVLFGELYFAKPKKREYERDSKGRFKSKECDRTGSRENARGGRPEE